MVEMLCGLLWLEIMSSAFSCVKSFKFSQEKPDYYSYLHVGRHSSQHEIRASYRELSKLIHPDKNKCDPQSTEKFILLQNAYQTLSDKNRRDVYDRNNPRAGFQGTIHDWKIPKCKTGTEPSSPQLFMKQLHQFVKSLYIWIDPDHVEIDYNRLVAGIQLLSFADIFMAFATARFCVLFVISFNMYNFILMVFVSYAVTKMKQIAIHQRTVIIIGLWAIYLKIVIEDTTYFQSKIYGNYTDLMAIVISATTAYWLCCKFTSINTSTYFNKSVHFLLYSPGIGAVFFSVNFKITGILITLLVLKLYFKSPKFLA